MTRHNDFGHGRHTNGIGPDHAQEEEFRSGLELRSTHHHVNALAQRSIYLLCSNGASDFTQMFIISIGKTRKALAEAIIVRAKQRVRARKRWQANMVANQHEI